MTDLLSAVDALTKPTTSKHMVGDLLATVTLPPLLEQLDEAIRSNMGGTTPGGSDPRTRNMVNAGAFMKACQISSQLGDWARSAGSVIVKQDMGATLTKWHAKFIGTPRSAEQEQSYIRRMNGWAAQIIATLDPPKEADLPYNCPVCDASEFWFEGERYYRPLVIRYRPADEGMVEKARAVCRACEATWGVREIQYEIEKKETA